MSSKLAAAVVVEVVCTAVLERWLAERDEAENGLAHTRTIRLLLRPAVKPAAVALPLTQPPAQEVPVYSVQSMRDAQRPHTAEDLARVALRARHGSEATVEILTRRYVRHGHRHIDHDISGVSTTPRRGQSA